MKRLETYRGLFILFIILSLLHLLVMLAVYGSKGLDGLALAVIEVPVLLALIIVFNYMLIVGVKGWTQKPESWKKSDQVKLLL